MMKLTFASATLTALLLGGMVDTAPGQGFGISFEKHKKGKHFSFSLGFEGERGYRGVRRAPRPLHVHCDDCRRWIPARYEVVTERVWVPGHVDRVWVPPVYREVGRRHGHYRGHGRCGPRGGRFGRVVVRPGYWRTVEHPGHYELVERTVERPGYWATVCGY
jgi:hypothetical protein